MSSDVAVEKKMGLDGFMDFSRPGLFAGSPFATYDWSFRDPVFFAPFRPQSVRYLGNFRGLLPINR